MKPVGSMMAAATALALAGCQSSDIREARRSEQRLAMVKASGGSDDEVCAAARDVAAAWLKALDEDRYQASKTEADLACNAAAIARLTS